MVILTTDQVLGLDDALGNNSGWPWLLAITCLPPLLQLVILAVRRSVRNIIYLLPHQVSPRSPRYLAISLDMPGEARDALLQLRGGNQQQEVDIELKEMLEEAAAEKEPEMSLVELIGSSKLRLSLIICIVMHLSQQLSGMVAIFYYSISFFTR